LEDIENKISGDTETETELIDGQMCSLNLQDVSKVVKRCSKKKRRVENMFKYIGRITVACAT
jgi:hypothetical protein